MMNESSKPHSKLLSLIFRIEKINRENKSLSEDKFCVVGISGTGIKSTIIIDKKDFIMKTKQRQCNFKYCKQ